MLALRPMSFDHQGADVANLHSALLKLGFDQPIAPQERTEQRFRDGTAALSKSTRRNKMVGNLFG